jgi:membrane protein DedA with SNARE-associated domain
MLSVVGVWFQWVHDWGYPGIVLLMALESSVVPIPSELVIPPAAYWAAQGRYSIAGIVLAGTLGSYLGAAATYWVARWVGRPLLVRYGALVFCPESKLLRAERWLARYEAGGVFVARLVPVVRHVIGLPAGLVRMPFGLYSAMTILGAGLWCWVLAWLGQQLLGEQPELINDPALLFEALRERSWLIGGFALVMGALSLLVVSRGAPPPSAQGGAQADPPVPQD